MNFADYGLGRHNKVNTMSMNQSVFKLLNCKSITNLITKCMVILILFLPLNSSDSNLHMEISLCGN